MEHQEELHEDEDDTALDDSGHMLRPSEFVPPSHVREETLLEPSALPAEEIRLETPSPRHPLPGRPRR